MELYHRKLLSPGHASNGHECAIHQRDEHKRALPPIRLRPPPSLHAQPAAGKTNQKDVIDAGITSLYGVLGVALLLFILYLALLIYRSRQRNAMRTSNAPIVFSYHVDLSDELQGPGLDHPIWYINTTGLSQSVIDSISLFKYTKDQGLVDGTECSVCLNEFQEDESLRLLPKCSHAFHLPCIDTWLRSHTNCPLCRAPVVSSSFNDEHVAPSQPSPNTVDLGSRAESQRENGENNRRMVTCGAEQDGTNEVRNGEGNTCLPIDREDGRDRSSLIRNHHRVPIRDLVDSSQALEAEMQQPMRRSMSLDSTSTLANIVSGKRPGNSDSVLVGPKGWKSKNSGKRGGSGKASFHKSTKSCASGISLQKLPITMKRCVSSGGKFSFSRQSKNKESGRSF